MVPGIQGQAAPTNSFSYAFAPGWSDHFKAMFRDVLDVYEAHFDLTFTEVVFDGTSMGDTWVQYAVTQAEMADFAPPEYSDMTFTAYNYNWYDGGDAAYVFSQDAMQKYSNGYWVMMHEIGHALGLGHPFNDVASGGSIVDLSIDSQKQTMMSYSGPKDLATPSYLDFEALGEMYGLREANADDTLYGLSKSRSWTAHDSGGVDGIKYTGKCRVIINLNEGGVSKVVGDDSFGRIAAGSVIENAYGDRGNDRLIASTAENFLFGGAGDDLFVFNSAEQADGDTIAGFKTGYDRIKVAGLDDWAFSGQTFYGDTTGDGVWDFAIKVNNGVIRADDIV